MKKHRPPFNKPPGQGYKDWKTGSYGPPWQQGFEHFSKSHIDQRRKMGLRFAGGLLFLVIPILIVFVVLQRHIVAGFTMSGLK